MARSEYQAYLRTDEWREKRAACLQRDQWRCRCCGRKGVELHAHHVMYEARREDEGVKHLLTLCAMCHAKAHGKVKSTKKERLRLKRVAKKATSPFRAKQRRESLERIHRDKIEQVDADAVLAEIEREQVLPRKVGRFLSAEIMG